jgi:DDE superfamily endonuclease
VELLIKPFNGVSLNESLLKLFNEPFNESLLKLFNEPFNESLLKPFDEPFDESLLKPFDERSLLKLFNEQLLLKLFNEPLPIKLFNEPLIKLLDEPSRNEPLNQPPRCEPPPFRPRDAESARAELQHLVARAPEVVGQPGSRWTLKTVRAACRWMAEMSLSGVCRTLKRFGIRLKRGRDHVHSPDVHYVEKLADIIAAMEEAINSDGRVVIVFLDEFSFYRQPILGRDYCAIGRKTQPLAERSLQSDRSGRIIGGLNALSGQTTSLIASKIGLNQMVKFWQELCAAYPEAEVIYVVVDNWPIHFHPDVLAALEPQRTSWELKTPPSWPTEPSPRAKRLNLPIQLLPLPTYASWCNPIEKVWRWLKQELLSLHRYADDWPTLKQKVKEFLDRFRNGSEELLRYVGLTPNSKLFGALFAQRASPT